VLLGIHHTALSTPDLDRLVAFYRDHFEFGVAFDFRWDEDNAEFQRTHAAPETKGRVVLLERGASRLEVFEYVKPVPRPVDGPRRNADHGIAHLCFEVKDIEKEHARLAAAGVPFLSEPILQATVKVCYGRDPDGNLFELLEFLAGGMPDPTS
jgi:glyoxylase I family protein